MYDLRVLQEEITGCNRCPRLRRHSAAIAQVKRRAYQDWDYWGKPVPSFGDPEARLLILGLAPGAHGANRTGRMFTGDASGDFLYRALHETGFATQPHSKSANDGLQLRDAYITASARCAPPDNKPSPQELTNCRPFLERELELMDNVKIVVALGGIAFQTYLRILGEKPSKYEFGHGREYELGAGRPFLIASYHPSQQNTSTGRLTAEMLRTVFERARKLLS